MNASRFRRARTGSCSRLAFGAVHTAVLDNLREGELHARESTTRLSARRHSSGLRRGPEDKRSAHAIAELIGRVGKEIGGRDSVDTQPVIFNFFTNLNPLALAGSAHRRP